MSALAGHILWSAYSDGIVGDELDLREKGDNVIKYNNERSDQI